MVVTDDVLLTTYAGIKTEFDMAYAMKAPTAYWAKLASELPTTLPVQNYAFLGRGVVVEKFKDRVRGQELKQYPYFVADDVYKGDMQLERRVLEDDQYGLIKMRTQGMADETIRAWNRLVYRDGFAKAFSTLCYDQQFYFDVDHPDASTGGVVSNVTNAKLAANSLQNADAAMRLFNDDKGEPLEIVPTVLLVGPLNQTLAWELTESPIVVYTGSTTDSASPTNFANINKGRYEVVVSPYIKDLSWGLFDTSRAIKPFFIQSRSDVPWSMETDSLDGGAKLREEFNYAVRGRYGLGYGLWQCGYGSTGTA